MDTEFKVPFAENPHLLNLLMLLPFRPILRLEKVDNTAFHTSPTEKEFSSG